jgi:hypothetical protein
MTAQIFNLTGKSTAKPQVERRLRIVEVSAPTELAYRLSEEQRKAEHRPWVAEKMRDAIRQYRYTFSPEELLALLEEAAAAERRMIARSK